MSDLIREKKMQIVINNYFKAECDINTSIREAFEKGFRIGVQKGRCIKHAPSVERKKGKWIGKPMGGYCTVHCSVCREAYLENNGKWNYCPNCGCRMEREE